MIGKTLAENLEGVRFDPDQPVIRPVSAPLSPTGGVVGLKGTLAPAVPFASLTFGTIPAGGELLLTLPIPDVLPVGLGGIVLVDQGLIGPPAGGGVLSSPTVSVLVDEVP